MAPEIRPKSFGTFEKQAPSDFFFFYDRGGGKKFSYPNNLFFLLMLHALHLTVHHMAITEGNKCVLITRDPESQIMFDFSVFFFFDKVSTQGYTIYFKRPNLNFLHISKVVKILIQWSLVA